MKLGKHQRSKQRCQDLRWTLHNLLFCTHTLRIHYVTNMFLLVSPSVRSKQLLCFVQGQGQINEQKHTTKNFVKFHYHSPLLTIVRASVFPTKESRWTLIDVITTSFICMRLCYAS